MTTRDLTRLMWGDALSLLDQADRLHRQFCRPAPARLPAWEPPVDVVETTESVRIQIALPGATADSIVVTVGPGEITISARRPFPIAAPDAVTGARIHALEIPYGRFERRIGLPTQALTLAGRNFDCGCLTLTFDKKDSV